MEFADYREYQPGDDIRKLDTHLLARLGQHFVRQYVTERNATVTIAIDASASMNFGSPSKFDFAKKLASALAYIGLAGGDAVQIVACRDRKILRSSRLQGADRAPLLFQWIDNLTCAGEGFIELLPEIERRLPPRGLTFLLSDFWIEEPALSFIRNGRSRQEYVGVQILAPEELNPSDSVSGEHRLVDLESGEEIDIVIDQQSRENYCAALTQWQDQLRSAFSANSNLFIEASSGADIDSMLNRDWRKLGIVA